MKPANILMIGGAVADISLCPVDESIFTRHSTPIERIPMSTGGDALNESAVLARLGDGVRLVTLLGEDAVGNYILDQCQESGIDTSAIVQTPTVDTSVNVVLVDRQGERRFVTARTSSLRRLGPEHVQPALEHLDGIQIACFASIFVSPCFGPKELETLFSQLKERGLLLCADMTCRKNGETAEDLRGALQYVDFLFPNLEEGSLLTGESTPESIADKLLDCGVKCVVLKLGKDGCYIKDSKGSVFLPAYPHSQVVDTTGAGDTFAGSFLHCLLAGFNPIRCAQFANAAASICVEHTGCASGLLDLKEIDRREKIISAMPSSGTLL